jgi:hypothetical protein
MVREKTMPMTEIPKAAAIRRAMKSPELGGIIDDVFAKIDEMELDRRLEISMAQTDRGELRPAREALREIKTRY